MSDVFEREVYCLLGLPFDAVDMAGAVLRIRDAVARRQRCFLSTPNVNFLVSCLTDHDFRNSIVESDLSVADGMPLVWIARLLRIPILERVAGSEVFENLCRSGGVPIAVYFFGGVEGVAEAACGKLNSNRGGLVCVGHEFPGYGSIEDMSSDETIARINGSGADFIVVSLGAKKGQAWIMRNRNRLSAPMISHLGAVSGFVAGTVLQAPSSIRRLGLEWLWRIKEEPGLWRRYFLDGLVLIRLVMTRVLPLAWFMVRHRPTREEVASAAIDVQKKDGETVVRLRGAWVRENLEVLKECVSKAVRAQENLHIDLACASYVDASFLGLMLMLDGVQKKRAGRVSFGPVSPTIRSIFTYSCSEYLLEGGQGRGC